ncbi:hypothetical protein [Acuticoccus kandeliae]|uniref:hypothetical protein n=1 Tax=Acuticoccus kandeliae TaxID=2073160 RepID=UPI000D3E579E|nr:hypothetical protein [Acuticoccus kandeliae]
MMLAVFADLSGPVDQRCDLKAGHQPLLRSIEAQLYGLDMRELGRQHSIIRYENESRADPRSSTAGIPVKIALAHFKALNDCARYVLAHDLDHNAHGIDVARYSLGGRGSWLRPPQHLIDTAKDAATAMGLEDRLPSLAEATEALLGEARTGLDAVLELFGHQSSRKCGGRREPSPREAMDWRHPGHCGTAPRPPACFRALGRPVPPLQSQNPSRRQMVPGAPGRDHQWRAER